MMNRPDHHDLPDDPEDPEEFERWLERLGPDEPITILPARPDPGDAA